MPTEEQLIESIAAAIFVSRGYQDWYPNGFANAPTDIRAMCLRDARAALDVVRKSEEESA